MGTRGLISAATPAFCLYVRTAPVVMMHLQHGSPSVAKPGSFYNHGSAASEQGKDQRRAGNIYHNPILDVLGEPLLIKMTYTL